MFAGYGNTHRRGATQTGAGRSQMDEDKDKGETCEGDKLGTVLHDVYRRTIGGHGCGIVLVGQGEGMGVAYQSKSL